MKCSLLLLLLVLSSPPGAFCGRIPPIPAGHRAQYLLLRPDGGYSSGYDTGLGQSAIEEGDARNEVRGEYVGGPLRVQYTAGVAGYVPTVEVQMPATPVYASIPHLSLPPPPHPQQSLYLQRTSPVETANDQVIRNPDGSYHFAYQTSDHSRQESADARNNVQGSFSFVAKDDGIRRRVDYQAGAQTGFTAQGAHLPTAPQTSVPVPQVTVTVGSPQTPVSGPADAGVLRNPDGSYAFAYQTPDQSRHESADAQNNVVGSFSFVAKDDGIRRRVDYQAGAQTGFTAQGAHLPTAPPTYQTTAAVPLPPPPSSTSLPPPQGLAPQTSIGEQANVQTVRNPDGSYAFAYETSDQSRQESADAQNNVQGSFSFVAKDDGIRRTVDYKAGAQTGFVAQGAHLPTAPQAGVTDSAQAATETDSTPSDYDNTTPSDDASGSGNADASYQFSYQTPDQERAESADRAGNVRGHYSFVAPDGIRRRVDIEAGAGKGVIARGDHLPTTPSVLTNAGSNFPQNNQYPGAVVPQYIPYSGAVPPQNNQYPGAVPLTPVPTTYSGSWSTTVPDPLRVDTSLGNLVVRTYLPSHPVKAGYVLDVE